MIDDINRITAGAQNQGLPRQHLPEAGKMPEDSFIPQTNMFFGQGIIEKLFGSSKDVEKTGGVANQGPAQASAQPGIASSRATSQPPAEVSLKVAAQQLMEPHQVECEELWTMKLDSDRAKYFPNNNGPVIAYCSGRNSQPSIKGIDSQSGEKPLWSHFSEDGSLSEPFIAGDLVLFGEKGKGVVALDSRTGKELRRFPTEGQVEYSPCIDDRGRLFCADSMGQVYSFDVASGELLWRRDMGHRKPSEKTLVIDNMVIFRDSEGAIHGIDGNRGKKKWKFRTGECRYYRPVEGGSSGLIYTRKENELNTLLAIDAKKGKVRWKVDTEGWIDFYSADRGSLYLGAGKSLSAINGATGEKIWEILSPGCDFKHPPTAGADGLLYVHNEFTRGLFDLSNPDLDAVLCIEPQSGQINWVTRFPRYGPMYNSSPLPCEGGRLCLPSLHGDVLTGFFIGRKAHNVGVESQAGDEPHITAGDDQDFVDVDGIKLPRNAMSYFTLREA